MELGGFNSESRDKCVVLANASVEVLICCFDRGLFVLRLHGGYIHIRLPMMLYSTYYTYIELLQEER